jgi:hypothetical protein
MQDFDDSQEDQVRLNPPAGRPSLVGVLYYPDILDLRYAGYELERFEGLLLAMDSATFRRALAITSMLHRSDASPIWNAKRAYQVELLVLDTLHEYGLHQVPQLLRRILGRVFEDEVVWTDIYKNPDNCRNIEELENRLYVVPDIGLGDNRQLRKGELSWQDGLRQL